MAKKKNEAKKAEETDNVQEASHVPYLGNRTPCAHCGAVKLHDRYTQACVVEKTCIPNELQQIRYLLCRNCSQTFVAIEYF